MEHALSSLSYKGSIAEAISEAKQNKKLFVVYISGDNLESKSLESTWLDPTVSETLSKYCILLHILEGSPEARSFSEIYPQQSIPCITVVGYNGALLWKNEGLVGADVLASSLEKAWLNIHFQETTAAFLTAALSSREQLSGGISRPSPSGQVNPELHSATGDHDVSLDAANLVHLETDKNDSHEANKDIASKQDGGASSKLHSASMLNDGELDDGSASVVETGDTMGDSLVKAKNDFELRSPDPRRLPSISEVSLKNSNAATLVASFNTDDDVRDKNEVTEMIVETSCVVPSGNTENTIEDNRSADSGSSVTNSSVVFLNIRLPSGSSSQAQFSVNDTLRMVKDYVSKNEGRDVGSLDIAIPYPRKVFDDQDLDRTLSELGFFSRQALILVHRNTSLHSAGGPLQRQNYSVNDADASIPTEGYWASLRRIFSYVNPFSYLTRYSSSQSVPQGFENRRQTGSSPQTGGDGGAPPPFSPSQPPRPSVTRQLPSRFGANIHTLNHEGENDHSSDRNTFWNGNSTEFGGDDDDGK